MVDLKLDVTQMEKAYLAISIPIIVAGLSYSTYMTYEQLFDNHNSYQPGSADYYADQGIYELLPLRIMAATAVTMAGAIHFYEYFFIDYQDHDYYK